MKTYKLMTLAAMLAMTLVLPAFAEQAMDQDAAMDAWTKAAQPGQIHEFLAKKAGKWKVTTKVWMQPGTDPMVNESENAAEMILGGRFLVEHLNGESMGQPFEGMGVTGFDNTTGIVTAVWYDNFGTVTTVLTGEYATPGEPMELKGQMTDPMSGMEMGVRTVTNFTSDDEHAFEYYVSTPMGEMKVMEMVSTRAE